MRFDINDLRLYLAIAEERNLTRAAKRRNLSVPAASARVRLLEEDAGMPLLFREPRGVRLTPAGESFLYHAREVLLETDRLKKDMLDHGSGLRGVVRIYANTAAVQDFLPDVVPAFLAAHSRVNVDLQERLDPDVARGVYEGWVELGIIAGEVDMLGLDAIHLSTDRLVLIAPSRHRFARRKRVTFRESLEEDFIGMYTGSALQNFLNYQASRCGTPMRTRIQLNSFDTLCQVVAAGVGVAIIPASAASRNLAALKLVQIDLTDDWSVRERYILVRDKTNVPPYSADLLKRICDYFQRMRNSS